MWMTGKLKLAIPGGCVDANAARLITASSLIGTKLLKRYAVKGN